MKPVVMIAPVSIESTTPIVSAVVNTLGFNALTLLFATGALTDLVASVLIEDSSDNSVFVAVEDRFLIGNQEANLANDAGDDDKLASVGYTRGKQFVRVTVTPTTATAVTNLYSLVGILSEPQPMNESNGDLDDWPLVNELPELTAVVPILSQKDLKVIRSRNKQHGKAAAAAHDNRVLARV